MFAFSYSLQATTIETPSKIYYSKKAKDQVFSSLRSETILPSAERNVKRTHHNINGQLATLEKIKYQAQNLLSYSFESKQTKDRGSIVKKADKLVLTYSKKGKKEKSKSIDLAPNLLIGDQVMDYLRANWDKVSTGKVLKVKYIALSRLESIDFEFVKTAEEVIKGKNTLKVKMSPSSWLISKLVDPIFFYIEKDNKHRLLALEGRVTPKKYSKHKKKWKNFKGYVVYQQSN